MAESSLGDWTAPLLMIPGLALLTISTANRISAERLSLASRGSRGESSRLRMLRHALTALYFGILVDALAGLIGGLLRDHTTSAESFVLILSCLGVGALIVAVTVLTVEGVKSYE